MKRHDCIHDSGIEYTAICVNCSQLAHDTVDDLEDMLKEIYNVTCLGIDAPLTLICAALKAANEEAGKALDTIRSKGRMR